MVDSIRFDRGGNPQRFRVQRVSDLDEVRDQIDDHIQRKIVLLDTFSQEKEGEDHTQENQTHLIELESKISALLNEFEQFISGCEICSSLKEIERKAAEDKLLDLKIHSSSIKKIFLRKLALANARVLIKLFWSEKREIQLPIDNSNRHKMELFFQEGQFSKRAQLLQKSLAAISNALESTRGLTGNHLYAAMIRKGELLEAKEELLTAFIEYKRTVAERYAEFKLNVAYPPLSSPILMKRLEEGMENLKGDPVFIEKISQIILSSRYSTPVSLLNDSLSLAQLQAPDSDLSLTSRLSTASHSIALGFALPVSLLNGIKLIRDRARRRKLMANLEDSKEIQSLGDLMYREGVSVRDNTSKVLKEKIDDEGDLEKWGVLLKQANRMIVLGLELKETAFVTQHELEKEISTIKFSLFNQVISTPLQLSGIAANSLKLASECLNNSAVSTGLNVMHFIGIASGSIGLVLGVAGVVKKAIQIHDVRKKLSDLDKRGVQLAELEKRYGADPLVKAFCDMEKTKLFDEKEELKIELRNCFIELFNSILLTIGGAIALTATILGTAATGGLSIAVLVIVSVSAAIIIAHWAKKKQWQIEKKPIDVNNLPIGKGDITPIADYLKLQEPQTLGLEEEPKLLLQHHFRI